MTTTADQRDAEIMRLLSEENDAEGWNWMQHAGAASWGLEGEWFDEFAYANEGPDVPGATV